MKTKRIAAPCDIKAVTTDPFVQRLAVGEIPWQTFWKEHPVDGCGRPFEGINVWLLVMLGYARNIFFTQEQLIALNAWPKKGQAGHTVVASRIKEGQRMIEYCQVFNIDQVHGIQKNNFPPDQDQSNPIKLCGELLLKMPQLPMILDVDTSVAYSAQQDIVYMPAQQSFRNFRCYFSGLFYALIHATGHPKRLNRDSFSQRTTDAPQRHSLEGLIAEMGCALLCSYVGIEPWYLVTHHPGAECWLGQVKNDMNLIPFAAMYADEAVEYILA